MNKVIFLDIDGVLCSARSAAAHDGYPVAQDPTTWDKFDSTAIALLGEAMEHTGAQLVLTSSWRMHANLGALEYRLGRPIRDVTRDDAPGDTRGHQIQDWLMVNPDVTKYAILDDKQQFLPQQDAMLALTSERNGFLLGHFDKVLQLLGGGIDKPNDDA